MSNNIRSFEDQVLEFITNKGRQIDDLLKLGATVDQIKSAHDALVVKMDEFRKHQISAKVMRTASLGAAALLASANPVSEDCARHLAGVAISRGITKGLIAEEQLPACHKFVGEILGKAALTTTDIPLPTNFGSEVVELVAAYGQARRFGTVFPLSTGQVKLPKLKTSPAFGLIAISAAIAQKSPQFEFVTFNAEKWGGLIILPNEIDVDSVVALGQFIARYAAREMAKLEDLVFFAADGTATYDSLEGLTKSVVTDTKTVALAATKVKNSDATLAKIRELRTVVDSPALAMGAYYFHPSFEQLFSGLNTSGDKPYIANGVNGASLDGFPIRWIDSLPPYSTANAAGQVFGLFGDLSYQYLGVRGTMRFDTSDAPGFANDQLYIRAIQRFTIGKMATGAVGGLITAAS